jgi:hypothetical protein
MEGEQTEVEHLLEQMEVEHKVVEHHGEQLGVLGVRECHDEQLDAQRGERCEYRVVHGELALEGVKQLDVGEHHGEPLDVGPDEGEQRDEQHGVGVHRDVGPDVGEHRVDERHDGPLYEDEHHDVAMGVQREEQVFDVGCSVF